MKRCMTGYFTPFVNRPHTSRPIKQTPSIELNLTQLDDMFLLSANPSANLGKPEIRNSLIHRIFPMQVRPVGLKLTRNLAYMMSL